MKFKEGMRCWYCGVLLSKPPSPGNGKRYPKKFQFPSEMFTQDHSLPRFRGGKFKVPACWGCNTLKGQLLPDEFRLVIAYRGWQGDPVYANPTLNELLDYKFYGEKGNNDATGAFTEPPDGGSSGNPANPPAISSTGG
jgi:hypothetical protein